MLPTRQEISAMRREASKAMRTESKSSVSDGVRRPPNDRRVAARVRDHRRKRMTRDEMQRLVERRLMLIRMLQEHFDLTRAQAEAVVREIRASYSHLI